jgi:hypothetical protein
LDTDELSAFTLEFINDCPFGRDTDGAVAIKDLLRCPASDSAQTHVDHFQLPPIISRRHPDLKNDQPERGHSNHEQNRNQPILRAHLSSESLSDTHRKPQSLPVKHRANAQAVTFA